MVTTLGRAKINLTLDILGLRDDGYHEIATVMQSLALADTLTLTRQEEGISLSVDLPGLVFPSPQGLRAGVRMQQRHCAG